MNNKVKTLVITPMTASEMEDKAKAFQALPSEESDNSLREFAELSGLNRELRSSRSNFVDSILYGAAPDRASFH